MCDWHEHGHVKEPSASDTWERMCCPGPSIDVDCAETVNHSFLLLVTTVWDCSPARTPYQGLLTHLFIQLNIISSVSFLAAAAAAATAASPSEHKAQLSPALLYMDLSYLHPCHHNQVSLKALQVTVEKVLKRISSGNSSLLSTPLLKSLY